MAIKFNCPHCNKPRVARESQAGKRAPCPDCKQVLTIPSPVGQPADLEALAAEALADKKAEPEPPKAAPIQFQCPMCDEKISVSSDLAGKQTPCPECRRIIKVPQLVKSEPIDWRRLDSRGPSLARQNEPAAPEGAWGSTVTSTLVSREALEEAAAIPEVKIRLTWAQKIKRTLLAVAVVGVLGSVAWLTYANILRTRQHRSFARAVAYLDDGKTKLAPEAAAELNRAAGEYLIRIGKAEDARTRFQNARGLLRDLPPESTDRELRLTDLAVSQVELGGDKREVMEGTRLRWEEVAKELRQTLQNLKTPEGTEEALRRVSRQLIQVGQTPIAQTLASQLSAMPEDAPGNLALVGLELLRAKQTRLAETLLDQAIPPGAAAPVPPPDGPQANRVPPAALTDLCVALGKADRIDKLFPQPKEKDAKEPEPAIRIGNAGGLARKGEVDRARGVARLPGSALARLEASLALAAALVDNQQAEAARPDIEEAIRVFKSERMDRPVSPWVFCRLVSLAAQAGLADQAEEIARIIPDAGLRGQAQLELLRARLAASKDKVDEAIAQNVDKACPAHSLAREEVARHNARLGGGSDVQKAVEAWEPEWLRPFGYMGIALGVQGAVK
jgi:transcription elongation factor Elf1